MRISNDISWQDVDWPLVSKRVTRLQRRIYEAKKSGVKSRLHFLQNLLINSTDARLFAVYQETSFNKERDSPELEKKVATTGKERLEIARSLFLNGKAQPIRKIWIDKPGKGYKAEKRLLGIPTIIDRAKQALAKLALEPEWEAVFEPNSYGFRPGRGAHDAMEAIFKSLAYNIPKKGYWVYDANIRNCFATISHDALLSKVETFPKMKSQISAWLKAGVLEGYANTPKKENEENESTPQGYLCGVISPLLCNIALHGLENHLKSFVMEIPESRSNRSNEAKGSALGVVRYADSFVFIHSNRAILDKCIEKTKVFLGKMSLNIIDEKFSIKDSREGFQFLGFQTILSRRKDKYVVKMYPSRKNQGKFLLKIRGIIQQSKSRSSYDLIEHLYPIIKSWGNYYQYCECSLVFARLQRLIFQKLRAWVFRRDKRNNRTFVKEKYFPTGKTYTYVGIHHKDNWILNGQKKEKSTMKTNYLPSIAWIKSKRFVQIEGTRSPMDGNTVYWSNRFAK